MFFFSSSDTCSVAALCVRWSLFSSDRRWSSFNMFFFCSSFTCSEPNLFRSASSASIFARKTKTSSSACSSCLLPTVSSSASSRSDSKFREKPKVVGSSVDPSPSGWRCSASASGFCLPCSIFSPAFSPSTSTPCSVDFSTTRTTSSSSLESAASAVAVASAAISVSERGERLSTLGAAGSGGCPLLFWPSSADGFWLFWLTTLGVSLSIRYL
mmetsp:Transcript_14358/g.35800  ORF Transcript_14358/g.35800 Transcript_14358/m.35800 type:complete len:213 (-) Transcript_14358:125-763(-)